MTKTLRSGKSIGLGDPSQFEADDSAGSMQNQRDEFHDAQQINWLQLENQFRFVEIGLELSSVIKEQQRLRAVNDDIRKDQLVMREET